MGSCLKVLLFVVIHERTNYNTCLDLCNEVPLSSLTSSMRNNERLFANSRKNLVRFEFLLTRCSKITRRESISFNGKLSLKIQLP